VSAKELEFRFTTEASVVHKFTFEGGWDFEFDPVYRSENSDTGSKLVEEIRHRWDISGKLVTPDGTDGKGWDTFLAFVNGITGAGGDPVAKVELVRDPDGEAVVELTLDEANDYYDLRVDLVTSDKPAEVPPKAIWQTVFPLTVTVSARKIGGAIAPGEPVTWEQTLNETYRNGLRRLESVVIMTTREGTNAATLARTLASLPIPGPTYSYKTGNTVDANGVDVESLDADTRQDPDRIPTRVIATSVIEQNGLSVGNLAGGGAGIAPDEVFWEDQQLTIKADGKVQRTRNVAASGPNAKAWCLDQKPSWAVDEFRRELRASSGWAYTWTAEEADVGSQGGLTTALIGELSGGGQVFSYEPVAGGFPPVRFDGPFTLWRFSLTVLVTRQGSSGLNSDLPLPPLLPAPWSLDREASGEGEPVKQEPGKQDSESEWTREARLSYVSPAEPDTPPVKWLRDQTKTVDSYLLGGLSA
jgi:hypothetical protein